MLMQIVRLLLRLFPQVVTGHISFPIKKKYCSEKYMKAPRPGLDLGTTLVRLHETQQDYFNRKVNKLSLCLIKHHSLDTCGGIEVYLHAFVTSTPDVGRWSASCTGHFSLRERAPSTQCIEQLVGSKTSLNSMEKRNLFHLP
jgi:hypothetical protein